MKNEVLCKQETVIYYERIQAKNARDYWRMQEITGIQVKNARVYWYRSEECKGILVYKWSEERLLVYKWRIQEFMRHYKDLKHLNRNFRLAYTCKRTANYFILKVKLLLGIRCTSTLLCFLMYTDRELDSHRPILYESLHYLAGFEASYSVHWLIFPRQV